MNNLDKTQMVLEGRCPECKDLVSEHLASQCVVAAKEFSDKMDKIWAEIYEQEAVPLVRQVSEELTKQTRHLKTARW